MDYKAFLLTTMIAVIFSLRISGQDLSSLQPIAWYPLIDSTGDKLHLKPDVTLTNAPFQGAEGVYSNGMYLFSGQSGGCLITSPSIAELYDTTFAVSLEFKIDSFDGESHPIIILGDSWRYLGFSILYDNRLVVEFNGFSNPLSEPVMEADKWYELTVIYRTADSTASYYLDSVLIDQQSGPLIRGLNDDRISNTHYGVGSAFLGNWRNLKIFGSKNISSSNAPAWTQPAIELYPNPTRHALQISQQEYLYDQWEIINLHQGMPILRGTMKSELTTISTISLPAGAYIFRGFNARSQTTTHQLFVKL